ncbi:DbpA RNA binding domain-containing protein, partial [Francisella tularensis]|uniref:DbpA RNA binding domain-containing protein n=1 Tax=Francisella tularensis TaxID=263 RepID=UPI00238193D2
QARNSDGAIATEGNIDSKHICHISIQTDYTLVDLPANLSPKVIKHLKKDWVAGKKLNLNAQ